jgi:hypothetical protein
MAHKNKFHREWHNFNIIFWPSLFVIAYYVAIAMTAYCQAGAGLVCGFDFSLGSNIIWTFFRFAGPLGMLALPLSLAFYGYKFSDDAAGLIYVFVPLIIVLLFAIGGANSNFVDALALIFPFASYFIVYHYYREHDQLQD